MRLRAAHSDTGSHQDKDLNYQAVVPSTWNHCDHKGQRGPYEALIGTLIADPNRPVEF
jgi:Ni,Fe-hydrogenase I large subunit